MIRRPARYCDICEWRVAPGEAVRCADPIIGPWYCPNLHQLVCEDVPDEGEKMNITASSPFEALNTLRTCVAEMDTQLDNNRRLIEQLQKDGQKLLTENRDLRDDNTSLGMELVDLRNENMTLRRRAGAVNVTPVRIKVPASVIVERL